MQKLILGVVGFVALLLVIGFALPAKSRFVATITIDAHPATVFALVNDMRRAALWAPVGPAEPGGASARVVYSGPARGRGSTVSWSGTSLGSGTQTITASRPYTFVETLINPGEAGESRTWFELGTTTGATVLNRGFERDYGFDIVGRYIGIIKKGVIQRDYEHELANLKELAENLPKGDFGDLRVERLHVEPEQIVYQPINVRRPSLKSRALGDAYFEILGFIEKHDLAPAGAPLAITRGGRASARSYDAAIPVSGITDTTPTDDAWIHIGTTYSGNVLRFTHTGSYARLNETYRKIFAYMAALDIERSGDIWETYVSDPAVVDEAKLETFIYYPVADR